MPYKNPADRKNYNKLYLEIKIYINIIMFSNLASNEFINTRETYFNIKITTDNKGYQRFLNSATPEQVVEALGLNVDIGKPYSNNIPYIGNEVKLELDLEEMNEMRLKRTEYNRKKKLRKLKNKNNKNNKPEIDKNSI